MRHIFIVYLALVTVVAARVIDEEAQLARWRVLRTKLASTGLNYEENNEYHKLFVEIPEEAAREAYVDLDKYSVKDKRDAYTELSVFIEGNCGDSEATYDIDGSTLGECINPPDNIFRKFTLTPRGESVNLISYDKENCEGNFYSRPAHDGGEFVCTAVANPQGYARSFRVERADYTKYATDTTPGLSKRISSGGVAATCAVLATAKSFIAPNANLASLIGGSQYDNSRNGICSSAYEVSGLDEAVVYEQPSGSNTKCRTSASQADLTRLANFALNFASNQACSKLCAQETSKNGYNAFLKVGVQGSDIPSNQACSTGSYKSC